MLEKGLVILVTMQMGIILNCGPYSFGQQREVGVSLPSEVTTGSPIPTRPRTDCSNPETGWKLEKLNGKVKSLREEKIEYGYGDHKRELTRLVTFTSNGDYVKDAQREFYRVLNYSKVNKPKFIFDKDCRILERHDPKRPWLMAGPSRTVFSYSRLGTVKETAIFDSEGHLQWRSVASLDENERVIETRDTIQEHPEHFKPKRYDVYRHTRSLYKLDELGNQIEEISYNWKGELYATYQRAYDSARRLVRELRKDHKDRPINLVVYSFDQAGLLREKLEYMSSGYSGLDELIPGTIDSGFGKFQTGSRTTYDYDGSSNWIKKTEFDVESGEKLSETFRTIRYY